MDGSLSKYSPLETLVFSGPPPEVLPPRDWNAVLANLGKEPAQLNIAPDPSLSASVVQKQQPAAKSGFLSGIARGVARKVDSTVSNVASNVVSTVASTVPKVTYLTQGDVDDFTAAFPRIAHSGTRLRAAFTGSVMHKGAALPCIIYISTSDVCFYADNGKIRDAIPLSSISAWLPSVALPTDPPNPPFFLPLVHSSIAPTAIMFFTDASQCVQVFQIAPRGTTQGLLSGNAANTLKLVAEFAAVWEARGVKIPDRVELLRIVPN